MSTPNKLAAEELRKKYRKMEATLFDKNDYFARFAEGSPIALISFEDLVSGPDSELGPNQILLRELIIQLTLQGRVPENLRLEQGSEDDSPDNLAKEVIDAFASWAAGNFITN